MRQVWRGARQQRSLRTLPHYRMGHGMQSLVSLNHGRRKTSPSDRRWRACCSAGSPGPGAPLQTRALHAACRSGASAAMAKSLMHALDLVSPERHDLRTAWETGNLDGIRVAPVVNSDDGSLLVPRNPIAFGQHGAPGSHNAEFRDRRGGIGALVWFSAAGRCAHGVNHTATPSPMKVDEAFGGTMDAGALAARHGARGV